MAAGGAPVVVTVTVSRLLSPKKTLPPRIGPAGTRESPSLPLPRLVVVVVVVVVEALVAMAAARKREEQPKDNGPLNSTKMLLGKVRSRSRHC